MMFCSCSPSSSYSSSAFAVNMFAQLYLVKLEGTFAQATIQKSKVPQMINGNEANDLDNLEDELFAIFLILFSSICTASFSMFLECFSAASAFFSAFLLFALSSRTSSFAAFASFSALLFFALSSRIFFSAFVLNFSASFSASFAAFLLFASDFENFS